MSVHIGEVQASCLEGARRPQKSYFALDFLSEGFILFSVHQQLLITLPTTIGSVYPFPGCRQLEDNEKWGNPEIVVMSHSLN